MKGCGRFACIGLFVFIIILSLGIWFFSSTGFGRKQGEVDSFKDTMLNNGYYVSIEKYRSKNHGYIVEGHKAQNSEKTYQIEFYVINSTDNAKKFVEYYKSSFERLESSMKTDINLPSYSKFVQVSNGRYCVISRKGKVVVLVDADEQYRTEINSVLNELGY